MQPHRGPESGTYTQKSRWMTAGLLVWICLLGQTAHITGWHPAGHHSVKHVKFHPKDFWLSISKSTSQSACCWACACIIIDSFQNSTMRIFYILPFFNVIPTFSPGPILAYYISPTQRKWILFPSTSRIWAALWHSDGETERQGCTLYWQESL